jgi:hypothetical protein
MTLVRFVTFAIACGAFAVASTARAQPQSDAQIAQALFDEGRDLMDKRDFVRACPLLERSQKLDPGGGTLLNLAICFEGEGKLARATTAFDTSLSLARKDGRKDREDIAIAHLDALAPRVPHVRLVLREQVPGVVVHFDEFIEGPEVIGVLAPVDPGAHHIRVSAQGRQPWDWSGTLAEGQRLELDVVLAIPPPPDPCIMQPLNCVPPEEKRLSTATWVFGGVAVASVIATAITGGIAIAAKGSFDGNCIGGRGYCADPVQGQSDYDTMTTAAWISTATLGVAVVSAIVALAWPRVVVAKKTGMAFVLRF